MSDCIEWQGARLRGYGIKLGRMAHRVIWEQQVGPIPEGLVLDHLCQNKACINVEHLEPVTQLENLRRIKTFNGNKTECVHGHPFDRANTRYRHRRDGTISRECRACNRIRVAQVHASGYYRGRYPRRKSA